ncbi:hypothetical protein [Burkholderia sp. Bp8963]|uniref:hypothetical protein n=1 Tax=Burkholderia sp. Bp8963 TaxID=2184547 RepID=UPI000F5B35DC|nr:hypothetical protein [Burkholderia sp. Bp8963]
MRRFRIKFSVMLLFFTILCQHTNAQASQNNLPPGAMELGYTKLVIDENVSTKDISPDGNGRYKFYNGKWYAKTLPSMDLYSDQDGMLAITQGGDLVSVARDFSLGRIPLLPGRDGFYVEFEARMTRDDRDNWPALWLMPIEHDKKKTDHYPGDPPGFERWMELDVHEGGNGPGITGTVHNWQGEWPNYDGRQNHNNVSRRRVDPTKFHTYGVSYDPIARHVTWWVDGVKEMSAGAPEVPEIASRQHFYLIMGAQTHGKRVEYTMIVRRIRAFVPQSSQLPAER